MVDARFFPPIGSIKLSKLLEVAKIEPTGISEQQLRMKFGDAATLSLANSDQISLAASKNYADALTSTKAGLVFVSKFLTDKVPENTISIECANPHEAFVFVLEYMFPQQNHRLSFQSDFPEIGDPEIEQDVKIGKNVVLGSGVQIGSGSVIGPNAVIAAGVSIGRNCIIGDNVTIEASIIGDNVVINSGARVGAKGFGWLDHAKTNRPIPQLGRVIIQSHADVGPNTTIDRGALGDTVIGENSKIGAMVEIGHNSIIGRNCLLAPMVGLAGGTILEDSVMMGASAASAGHLTLGEGSIVFARSSASKDWPAGSKLVGQPAMDMKQYWREQATLRRLIKGANKS